MKITVSTIRRAVALHYRIRVEDLTGPTRIRQVAWPRQMAMHIAHQLRPELSPTFIGHRFGSRDRTTVRFACRVVPERLESNPSIMADFTAITYKLQKALST